MLNYMQVNDFQNCVIPNGSQNNTQNKTKMSVVESSMAGNSLNGVLVLLTLLYVWNFS